MGLRDDHRMIRERATSLWATELIEIWVERGVAMRLEREESRELARLIRGIERALIDAVIMGPDYLVPLDRVAELARLIPEMDLRLERTELELMGALVEVVGRVEAMARFLAESATEDRFVILDGTFYAMRIVSALSDGVTCLERAQALWQVMGEYGAEQLDEILGEVCEPDGSFPRFDPMNAEALVSNLDLLELWTVNRVEASAERDGLIDGTPAPVVMELLAGARRLRDFAREALGRGCTLELA